MTEPGLCLCGCGQPTTLAPYSSKSKGWVKGQPVAFKLGHGSRLGRIAPSLAERVARRTVRRGPDECWDWTGVVSYEGYGFLDRRREYGESRRQRFWVHRIAYEEAKGQIPDGFVIDHLCRNRRCVNPAHLEAVPNRVNVLRGIGITAMHARQTHCKHGHPFDAENTGRASSGGRQCKTCLRERARLHRRQLREATLVY
jgi:hypothetical protein